MKKPILLTLILLISSCTLFGRGPDPYDISQWVSKPEVGTKLTMYYYCPEDEENAWTYEYTLSHIYEDDTIFTVYYTFFNDSMDGDLYIREDTTFYTVNYKTNTLWCNYSNPQLHGQNGHIAIKTPIEEGYIFDSNYDPFRTYYIEDTDTTYCTEDDTLRDIIRIKDGYSNHYYSLDYIFEIYEIYDYELNINKKLKDVE